MHQLVTSNFSFIHVSKKSSWEEIEQAKASFHEMRLQFIAQGQSLLAFHMPSGPWASFNYKVNKKNYFIGETLGLQEFVLFFFCLLVTLEFWLFFLFLLDLHMLLFFVNLSSNGFYSILFLSFDKDDFFRREDQVKQVNYDLQYVPSLDC